MNTLLMQFKPRDRRMMLKILQQARDYGEVVAVSDSIDWCMTELVKIGALEKISDRAIFVCHITDIGRDQLFYRGDE